mmetsp:Transcript_19289/g.37562  ORF Transcript_19289/g.37562 Transcript_19289/m.37562 type:complete len:147 (+) Transcript_19289:142-582(+)
MTSSSSSSSSSIPPIEDLEWEEWDPHTSPLSFFHHCLAGSFAGVAEHTLLYPLDTVKTCWQSRVLHRAGGPNGACPPCSFQSSSSSSSPGEDRAHKGHSCNNTRGGPSSGMTHRRMDGWAEQLPSGRIRAVMAMGVVIVVVDTLRS